tara:strand:- start:131 stop:385 length:255 start_codon:yes stop_codon:yes gene_type:complete
MKKFSKLLIPLFLLSFIMFISFMSIYHEFYEFFFALIVLALYLFFSKNKVDEKAKDLQINPKIAKEMAKKIISDAKKHRFEREL